MREPLRQAERWFAQARRDPDDARFARSGARYNLACFLAQQAAEKALKALLYRHGAEAVWGHSAAELCRDLLPFEPGLEPLLPTAAGLDKYDVPTRYPDALPGGIPADAYGDRDAAAAIEAAEAVLAAVAGRLPAPPP